MPEIDHLVVAASDLESGARWLEERLGVPLAAGGRHLLMGTHNRLLRLDGAAPLYLELIVIDPGAAAPARPRWFSLDTPALRQRLAQRPRLIHWVARSDDLDRDAGPIHGDILSMQRGDFSWRITVGSDGVLPGEGLVPTLIQWQTARHPAQGLPAAECRLMKLEGFHPQPAVIRTQLERLGLERRLALYPSADDEPAHLIAYLRTPGGLVELD